MLLVYIKLVQLELLSIVRVNYMSYELLLVAVPPFWWKHSSVVDLSS